MVPLDPPGDVESEQVLARGLAEQVGAELAKREPARSQPTSTPREPAPPGAVLRTRAPTSTGSDDPSNPPGKLGPAADPGGIAPLDPLPPKSNPRKGRVREDPPFAVFCLLAHRLSLVLSAR